MYQWLKKNQNKQTIFDEFDPIGGNSPSERVLKCKHCGFTFNVKEYGLRLAVSKHICIDCIKAFNKLKKKYTNNGSLNCFACETINITLLI